MLTEASACGLRCQIPPGADSAEYVQHDETYAHAAWALAGLSIRRAVPTFPTEGDLATPKIHPSAGRPGVRSVWQRWRNPVPILVLCFAYPHLNRWLSSKVSVASIIRDFGLSGTIPALELKLRAMLEPKRFWQTLVFWPLSGLEIALFATTAVMLLLAYILARAVTWAFWRAASQCHSPRAARLFSLLGLALPWALAAELASCCILVTSLWLAERHSDFEALGASAVWIGGLLSVAAYALFVGIFALFVAGIVIVARYGADRDDRP